MELNTHDKALLLGMKSHLAKDRERVNDMLDRELDSSAKKELRDIKDLLSQAAATINIIANKIRP